jgi:hypothetical protein
MRRNVTVLAGAVCLPVACAMAAGACSGPGEPGNSNRDGGAADAGATDPGTDGALPLGAPIVAPLDTWTWVDFPDSSCDDGTPTGIGILPSSTSSNVLVFLNGGGACWSYETCFVLNTSTHGPFGAAQFASLAGVSLTGTIFDHADADNPFKDYSDVFVPYCTGDLHAGNAVTTYTSDSDARTVHHAGHANILSYLARLAATFPAPGQLAITGSSAGGGGALFNYPTFRSYWPEAQMVLIDDSLPLFEKDGIPPDTRAAWYQSWNLGALVDPICGAGCQNDLSLFMTAVATRYPGDRMALLSSEEDSTVSAYFQVSESDYAVDLTALATDVLDPLGHFDHFFVAGTSHTMLGSPGSFTAGTTPLWTWLTQESTGDATWVSAGP